MCILGIVCKTASDKNAVVFFCLFKKEKKTKQKTTTKQSISGVYLSEIL